MAAVQRIVLEKLNISDLRKNVLSAANHSSPNQIRMYVFSGTIYCCCIASNATYKVKFVASPCLYSGFMERW